jgi:hypothetical protein
MHLFYLVTVFDCLITLLFLLLNIMTISEPDEGYHRNVFITINGWISLLVDYLYSRVSSTQ